MATLALPEGGRKNYYVSFYMGSPSFENRQLFHAFYGKDFSTEKAAKVAAIKCFLKRSNGCGFFDTVTLTEHNGFQLADKNEPYITKSAIVKTLAHKSVKI